MKIRKANLKIIYSLPHIISFSMVALMRDILELQMRRQMEKGVEQYFRIRIRNLLQIPHRMPGQQVQEALNLLQ